MLFNSFLGTAFWVKFRLSFITLIAGQLIFNIVKQRLIFFWSVGHQDLGPQRQAVSRLLRERTRHSSNEDQRTRFHQRIDALEVRNCCFYGGILLQNTAFFKTVPFDRANMDQKFCF